MNKGFIGVSLAGLCAVIASGTTLTVAPQTAEAAPGLRMCYVSGSNPIEYFSRDNYPSNYLCSSGASNGHDMPTRNGVDMSICENWSRYVLEVSVDACYHLTWQYSKDINFSNLFTKEEIRERVLNAYPDADLAQ